jgi:hypothetical protein
VVRVNWLDNNGREVVPRKQAISTGVHGLASGTTMIALMVLPALRHFADAASLGVLLLVLGSTGASASSIYLLMTRGKQMMLKRLDISVRALAFANSAAAVVLTLTYIALFVT